MRTFHPRLTTSRRRTLGVAAAASAAVAAASLAGTLSVGAAKAGIVAQTDAQNTPACTTGYQPRPGFSIDVCLAQNGNTVTPSVNVHQLGTYTSCTLALEIWDDANHRLDHPNAATAPACANGPSTGTPLDLSQLSGVTAHTAPDGSLTVHAFARLTVDGQSIYISGQGNSPTVTALTPANPAPNPAPDPAADPPATVQNPTTVPGCTDWPATKFLQTPLVNGSAAINGNAYNMGDHTGCNTTGYINQYYALDVEVPSGTQLRAPGGAGTVLWAGKAPARQRSNGDMLGGWQSCGNEVVMDYGDRYWSVQCHLGTIYVHTGQVIKDSNMVIALSDDSGLNPDTGQPWGPHLHFALFKGALMTPDGGVYDGQSAMPHHMRYFAGGGGYYEDLDYRDFPNGLTISN